MLGLDHIAVLGGTLQAATQACESAFGTELLPGGQHAAFGTHNRLLGLEGGLYLEAIAIDPGAPAPGRPRWFGLDAFTGPARLDKWICRVPDMAKALRALPEAGQPIALERGDLRWTMAVPDSGQLPFDGLFPALIEWHSPNPPGDRLPGQGRHLRSLILRHPQADALRDRLTPFLDSALIRFEAAPQPGMSARFETAQGEVVL